MKWCFTRWQYCQILIFTYAYALNFINRCFGSLFWLLGVPIGSLFHKKMGPYLKAWGSLLVLESVHMRQPVPETLLLSRCRKLGDLFSGGHNFIKFRHYFRQFQHYFLKLISCPRVVPLKVVNNAMNVHWTTKRQQNHKTSVLPVFSHIFVVKKAPGRKSFYKNEPVWRIGHTARL